MSLKVKLELQTLDDQGVIDLANLILNSMGGIAIFPAPDPALTVLENGALDMGTLIAQRDQLLVQAQTKTREIRTARNILEGGITTEGAYVERVVATLPADQQAAAIISAGMHIADGSATPVGPMPKVTGLTATTGDADGEIDLSWNAVRRGLQNFFIEITDDPAGLTGWHFAANSRKSTAAITGLTSGKRYWFRVTAEGAAGPGPASDPATKTAP